MKLKVVVSSLAFLFLFGVAAARADDTPKIDVFAGYSYMRGNPSRDSGLHGFNLNGAQFSVSYNLNSWLSGVAEIDGHHASRSDVFTCTIGNCPANGINGHRQPMDLPRRTAFQLSPSRTLHALRASALRRYACNPKRVPHQQSNEFYDGYR
jgi:hypothetical protein